MRQLGADGLTEPRTMRGGRHRARAVRAAQATRAGRATRLGGGEAGGALVDLCRLERRLFTDLADGGGPAEYQALLTELRRLLARCDPYPHLARQATELIALVEVIALIIAPDLAPPEPPEFAAVDPPSVLRVGLGRFVAARAPIPIAWAFAWHTNHPDRRWRAPATRCREEFASLFWLRYRQAYQGGLLVDWSDAVPELTFTYGLASPDLGGRRVTVHTGLPDVRQCLPERRALHALAERVQSELEPYAQFLARNPAARGTDDAFALLPTGLARPATPDLRRILEWCVAQLIETNVAVVSGATLLDLLPPQAGRVAPVGGLLLAYALDRRGIGIEPDPRAGGRELRAGDDLALFRRGTERVPRPTPALAAGTVLLHLAAAIGAREDLPLICDHLGSGGGLGLSEDEAHRLDARMHLVLHRQPVLGAIRRRLDVLCDSDRAATADLLIATLGADGQLSGAEVELLTDVYALLGLTEEDLTMRLATLGGSAGQGPGGFAILDPGRATQRLAKAAAVAMALAVACAEARDDPDPGPAAAPAAVNGAHRPAQG